jgi:hypothetical protein
MSSPVDIGHEVSIELRCLPGEAVPCGLAYWHPDGRGGRCEGWAPFNNAGGWPQEGWDVVSLDPLTIEPSLRCTACGHHGYVRGGRWVPA